MIKSEKSKVYEDNILMIGVEVLEQKNFILFSSILFF